MRVFLEKFESERLLSKNVNTQLYAGKFNPTTGDTIDVKRPTDYTSTRTSDGDVSSGTADSIITGKASAVVQDYITVELDWAEADEAIKMDQLDELIMPAATRIKTDLEVDYASFMVKNAALLAGTYGTAVTTWDHVARAGAVMEATGIPKDGNWNYVVNPYTQTSLSSNQRSLGAGGAAGADISDAQKNATLSSNFAGMNVMTGTTLDTVTLPTTGDLVGAMNGAPDVTYLTAKDSMTQTLAVNGFGTFTGTIPAGTVVQVTGVNRLNLSTRKPIIDGAGASVTWTATVTADAALTTGAGNLVVTGPAVFESAGAYNTTDVAIGAANVVTILGTDANTYQPNLFWHKNAYTITSVPIKKLFSTDTLGTTEDGLQIRVSKGASIRENKQIVRFDLRPAYGVLNPFFSGQGWGFA